MAISDPFRQSFLILRTHYGFFSLLLLLELIFFCIVGIFLYQYASGLAESMEEFTSLINEQKWLGEEPTQENLAELNIPSTDIAGFQTQYAKMLKMTLSLFLKIGIIFVLFRSLSVAISHYLLFPDKKKSLFAYLAKQFLVTSLFAAGFFLLFSLALKSTTSQFVLGTTSSYAFAWPVIGIIVLLYFFPVACGLLGHVALRRLLHETQRIGTRKFPVIAFYYLLLFLLLALPLILLATFLEQLGFLAVLLALLFLSAIVFARLALLTLICGLSGTSASDGAKKPHKKK